MHKAIVSITKNCTQKIGRFEPKMKAGPPSYIKCANSTIPFIAKFFIIFFYTFSPALFVNILQFLFHTFAKNYLQIFVFFFLHFNWKYKKCLKTSFQLKFYNSTELSWRLEMKSITVYSVLFILFQVTISLYFLQTIVHFIIHTHFMVNFPKDMLYGNYCAKKLN